MVDMHITCGEDLPDAPIAPGWHYWFYLVLPNGDYIKVLPEMIEDSVDMVLSETKLLEPRRSEARELLLEGARLAQKNCAVHYDSIRAQAELRRQKTLVGNLGMFCFLAPLLAPNEYYNGPGSISSKIALTTILGSFLMSGILILSSLFA